MAPAIAIAASFGIQFELSHPIFDFGTNMVFQQQHRTHKQLFLSSDNEAWPTPARRAAIAFCFAEIVTLRRAWPSRPA